MSEEGTVSEIEKLLEHEPIEEFRQKAPPVTTPSIETVSVLMQDLLTRVPSRSLRENLRKKLEEDCPKELHSSEAFHWRRSRWAALKAIHDRITQSLSDESPRPADSDFKADTEPTDKSKVFVVHGRNNRNRDAMFNFLRTIGLNPIEWSEALNLTETANPFIGEILAKAYEIAQAVVVLLTPDDLAYLKKEYMQIGDLPYEKEPTGQARPNVLFEAGMAFGSHPTRTVLVEIGRCRPFSDIAGRYVIKWDDSSMRRQDLAYALKRAGCSVVLEGTDWHTVGEFEFDEK